MPMFLATELIPKFHNGKLPSEKNGLLNSLSNLNKNRIDRLSTNNQKLDIKVTPLDLKSRLSNNLVDQQRIQNELSFNESQASAAREAGDLLKEIISKKGITNNIKNIDSTSDTRKLESKFYNISQASFNGKKLLEKITLTHAQQNPKNDSNLELSPGSLNDRNRILSSLEQIDKVKQEAEHRVQELRRGFQDLNIQNANIYAVGGKLNDGKQIQSSVDTVKRSFLTITADSIRVQANTNLNNTLMHLG